MPAATIILTLVIRIYDAYGVGAREVKTAEEVSTAILREAGIEPLWIRCDAGREREGTASSPCREAPRPDEVLIRIAAAPRARPDVDTLGFAYVDTSTEGGSLATVFADRIALLADAAQIDPGILLGRAMAHEIGHLLLGTTTHEARGLMRARWTPALLRHRNASDWLFSRDERERLTGKLAIARDSRCAP